MRIIFAVGTDPYRYRHDAETVPASRRL